MEHPPAHRKVVKAAAVQFKPVLYSRAATVEKVCQKIIDLGRKGVQFATFPETVIPSYPYYCFVQSPYKMGAEHYRHLEESVTVPSEATFAIGEACKQARMVASVATSSGKTLRRFLCGWGHHLSAFLLSAD